LNAQVRYVSWIREYRASLQREQLHEHTIRGAFVIDERNLKSLCRTLRLPEDAVLAEQPEQFTVPFLQAKGVYELVADRREARIEGELS